jgi:hypothetical protein
MRVSISTRRELVPDVSVASSSSISGRLRIIGRTPAAHCNTDDNAARTVKKGLRRMAGN